MYRWFKCGDGMFCRKCGPNVLVYDGDRFFEVISRSEAKRRFTLGEALSPDRSDELERRYRDANGTRM